MKNIFGVIDNSVQTEFKNSDNNHQLDKVKPSLFFNFSSAIFFLTIKQ
jgi:hypothetical protein